MPSYLDSHILEEKERISAEPLLAAVGPEDESDVDACTQETSPDLARHYSQRKLARHHQLCIAAFKVLVAGLALFGIVILIQAAAKRMAWPVEIVQSRSCNCGNSAEEILASDCRFDGIAAAFLPPHCRDDLLLGEFNRAGDDNTDGSWMYWANPEKSLRLNETDMMHVALHHGFFWASQKYHIVHCTFNWRKQWRGALLAGRGLRGGWNAAEMVEKRFLSEDHIKHCGEIAQMDKPLDKLATQSGISLNADLG